MANAFWAVAAFLVLVAVLLIVAKILAAILGFVFGNFIVLVIGIGIGFYFGRKRASVS